MNWGRSLTHISLPDSWRGRALVIGDSIFDDDWFSESELAEERTFRLRKRATEWKHARLAVKQLAIELGLCASARDCVLQRPRLVVRGVDTNRYVSISHSGNCAAAAIDHQPIGIDVERIRPMRDAAAHLFLTDQETLTMRDCAIDNRMLHFWAAKEAVWKQRNGETETLKRTPIHFETETATGLRFAEVETFATADLVVALTRPTSAADSSRR